MFRYTKNFSVGDVSFDLESDWHLPAGNIETVDLCLADLKSNQQSDWLVLAGDLFDTEDGEDVTLAISEAAQECQEITDELWTEWEALGQ